MTSTQWLLAQNLSKNAELNLSVILDLPISNLGLALSGFLRSWAAPEL